MLGLLQRISWFPLLVSCFHASHYTPADSSTVAFAASLPPTPAFISSSRPRVLQFQLHPSLFGEVVASSNLAFSSSCEMYRSISGETLNFVRRHASQNGGCNPDRRVDFENELYLERIKRMRDITELKVRKERLQRPPSNSTDFSDPRNVIISLLKSLQNPHDPVSYFGYETLYRSSTTKWKDVLRKSVGAPGEAAEKEVLKALSMAMERPNNQFGILVGLGADVELTLKDEVERSDDESIFGDFTAEFPSDPLDYCDGTAWVECRLRHEQTDTLLIVLGWSLRERDIDGAWLVDGIDWQDFREKYRPGIGRKEWERICG